MLEWTAADVLGHRSAAGRWLDELERARVPVSMVFAENDDGIEYLRNREGRRSRRVQRSGIVRAVEVPEVDHSMHRAWLPDRMLAAIDEQLTRT